MPEKDFVSFLPREQAFLAEMIAAAAARIAVVSVLIAFQILTFSIELHHYITRTTAGGNPQPGSDENNNNGNALKKEIIKPSRAPASPSWTWLGAVRRTLERHPGLVVFTGGHSSGASDTEKMISFECSSPTVDADIAGEGIRIAIWAQETVLFPFFVHQFAAGSLSTSVDDRDCACI